jgi:hypothetical protein
MGMGLEEEAIAWPTKRAATTEKMAVEYIIGGDDQR